MCFDQPVENMFYAQHFKRLFSRLQFHIFKIICTRINYIRIQDTTIKNCFN